MKVLLVHPEDDLPNRKSLREWDLIVDLGRAPAATYTRWSSQAGCPVISIYDFAQEMDDLRLCREHLKSGLGFLVDRFGIDWWDVLALGFVADLQQLTLFERLSNYLDNRYQLHATRPFWLATAFQNRRRSKLKVVEGSFGSVRRRLRHYRRVLGNLDAAQISQIAQDKFDRYHIVGRCLSRRRDLSNMPRILLPTAYVNVSRMAVRYAELLPDQEFLLVFARRSGKVHSLPSNVSAASLDSYFGRLSGEDAPLFYQWGALHQKLIREENIFEAAEHAGILKRVESQLQWLLPVRDAWANVLETENIAGCLSADDTNPYTRIPLLLTKNLGLPTIACHHGALDCWMTLKTLASDFYLAKSEMERDYLVHKCGVVRAGIVLDARVVRVAWGRKMPQSERTHIVFFTESYENAGWRSEEFYKALLPHLCSLAQICGLRLVLKLHPFDSIRGHRKMLRRILGAQAQQIELVAGAPTADLWQRTRFALTVESSTALECAAREIPIFLCTWLRDAYSGYVQQYAKFGIGYALSSPEQIADIPDFLKTRNWSPAMAEESINPETLETLFSPGTASAAPVKQQTFATCAASPILL